MSLPFRHATCNEAFKDWKFDEACRAIRRIGYTGIEIAPFTLAEDPASVPPSKRREYSDIIRSEGLEFIGFHWIMVSPPGLHVTAPDRALRERSWLHIRNLIDLSADLGPGGVLVFGSPNQRKTTGGLAPAEATANYVEGLRSVAPHAQDRGVTILVEALPANQCDVIGSLAEAATIAKQMDNPAVQTMFDSHNAVDETEPHDVLVDRYFDQIRHVHVNEMDGSHPAPGGYDFKPVFRTLRRRGYQGWISLEAFDFAYGEERLVTESLRYLEQVIAEVEQEVNA